MERTLLLDIVVTEGATVFELLSGKDQALLIRGNPFLVLDLGFHIIDGIRWFHIESNGLSREGLYEDLRWEAEATIERQWIAKKTGRRIQSKFCRDHTISTASRCTSRETKSVDSPAWLFFLLRLRFRATAGISDLICWIRLDCGSERVNIYHNVYPHLPFSSTRCYFKMTAKRSASKTPPTMTRPSACRLLIVVWALLVPTCSSHGGESDHRYKKGDHVELWVNKVRMKLENLPFEL